MLKILYAANNSYDARISLQRFLFYVKDKPYTIKIAAYKKSSPPVNIDWTLDSLLNIYNPNHVSLEDNDNLLTYYEQIKYYSPDLIISDLEYFTSYIANLLNVNLWQCSPLLINYAINKEEKYNLGLFKKYSYLLNRNPTINQRNINIIDNSNKNFIYSHFGDLSHPPTIKKNYEWIRPYHKIGKVSKPCQHNIVVGSLNNNKDIFSFLKNNSDCINFSHFLGEKYDNISIKNYDNQEEYFCNLRNCRLFVCEGQINFLADAFYNKKYTVVVLNFNNLDGIINSAFSEKFKLSVCIYDKNKNLDLIEIPKIDYQYNNKIHYLHEKIETLI